MMYKKDWTYFIKRLGLPYTDKQVSEFMDQCNSDNDVWDRFIASNPLYLAAAEANKIYGPFDVMSFLEQASYAGMRATFPSKSHGRGVIGPRLVPLRKLQEDGILPGARKEKPLADKATAPAPRKETRKQVHKSLMGTQVVHVGANGVSFGKGVILGYKDDVITVRFDSVGLKKLKYSESLEKGYIKLV